MGGGAAIQQGAVKRRRACLLANLGSGQLRLAEQLQSSLVVKKRSVMTVVAIGAANDVDTNKEARVDSRLRRRGAELGS